MRKNNNKLINIILCCLLFAALVMTVGFAAYSSQLEIRGAANVEPNRWSVHFGAPYSSRVSSRDRNDNILATVSPDGLSVSVDSFTLDIGETYGLEIPYINDGTFDAEISSIELTGIPDNAKPLLAYYVAEMHGANADIPLSGPDSGGGAGHYQMTGTYPVYVGEGISTDSLPPEYQFKPFVVPARQTGSRQYLQLGISYGQPSDPTKLSAENVKISPTLTIHLKQK